VSEKTVNEF